MDGPTGKLNKYFFYSGDNSDEVNCEMAPCTFGVCSQDCEVKIHKTKGHTKASSVNSKRNNITSASCSCVEGKVVKLIFTKKNVSSIIVELIYW